MLDIQTREEGDAAVMVIQGKVDSEVTPQLREVFRKTMATRQPKLFVINMEGVHFIDSSGLGVLIATRNNLDRNRGKLHLCGLSAQVRKTFDQTSLTKYFSVFATERDALSMNNYKTDSR